MPRINGDEDAQERAQQLITSYWDSVDDELRVIAPQLALEPIPARSRDNFTVYAARFASLESYHLFGYLSVPAGDGPFAGILEMPEYASVAMVPHHNDRSRYIVFTPMHRGQRLSDDSFRAPYPGLLTMGIANAESYIYRGVVADCLRAAEILAAQPKVDPARLAIVGNDSALLVAARRPQFAAARIQSFLFYRAMEACRRTDQYPLEEINDYLRDRPGDVEDVQRTLSLFDPVNHVSGLQVKTLFPIAGDTGLRDSWLGPLAGTLGTKPDRYRITHDGGTDNDSLDEWLAHRLGVQPMSRFHGEVS